MRHCTTERYWPQSPGFTSQGARRRTTATQRDYALNHHLERLPLHIRWDDEFSTSVDFSTHFGLHAPKLTVVTRCRKGHLHTVIHLSTEPYPQP